VARQRSSRKPSIGAFAFSTESGFEMATTGAEVGEILTFTRYETDHTITGAISRDETGALRVTRVAVEASGGVTSRMTKRLPPASVIPDAVQELPKWLEHLGDRAGVVARVSEQVTKAEVPRGGRPPLSAAYLREVAQQYLDLQRELSGRGVIKAMAVARDLPLGTMQDHVRRASIDGFLSRTTQGQRHGRAPGPRLLHPEEA